MLNDRRATNISSLAPLDDDYPRTRLTNGVLELSLFLPDAERGYYRGVRFDRAGIVEAVDYRGHRFFAPLHRNHDPLLHDAVSGPADEFAMVEPMGYAEAAPGESFVKIGVGLLARDSDGPYRFDGAYPLLRAGDWSIEFDERGVAFTQELTGDRGWAYRYVKQIRLIEGLPEMEVEYRLENRGEKTIDIDHYNHNFLIIDGTPYGPDYHLELPFGDDDPVDINGLAAFQGRAITVTEPLGPKSLWIELYRGEARTDLNAALLHNERSGAAIAFRGSAPIDRFRFWAVERAACPEPFSQLYLRPGQSADWSTRYRFFAAGESGAS